MLGAGKSGVNKGIVDGPKPVLALGESLDVRERERNWSVEEAISSDKGLKSLENDGENIEDDEVEGKADAKGDSKVEPVVDGEGTILRGGGRCF